MNIVLPMAGLGTRFKNAGYMDSKPFIDILGEPMVKRVIDNLQIDFNKNYHFIIICLIEDYEKYNIGQFIRRTYPNSRYTIRILDEVTQGAAETVLSVKDLINVDVPLLLLNSDQMIDYSPIVSFGKLKSYDGGMLCFNGSGEKWSYAKLNDDNEVIEVAEKREISNYATAGYYYWSKGSDFVKYAEEMILSNDTTNNEFYVAPVYNYAIKDGKKIGISMVDNIYQLGSPEDLAENISKLNDIIN